jgi:hypothetical protein
MGEIRCRVVGVPTPCESLADSTFLPELDYPYMEDALHELLSPINVSMYGVLRRHSGVSKLKITTPQFQPTRSVIGVHTQRSLNVSL